jgi:hypothetical protein
MSETKTCPKCGTECMRDYVDIGVGILYGPWGCPGCGWSEDPEYDHSEGQSMVTEHGGIKDQYGGVHPKGSSMELAYRLAKEMQDKSDEQDALRDEISDE